MGRALVRDFHIRCLYQRSHSLAALARSISDTSTRAKISYASPAHEVISTSMPGKVQEIYELSITRLPTEQYDRTIFSLLVRCLFIGRGKH